MRYGIHALICLDPEVRAWVVDRACEHVDWCRRFGIAVMLEDALSDVVDAEIAGFASRDWSRIGLACRWLGVDDYTAGFRAEPSNLDSGEAVGSRSDQAFGHGSSGKPTGTGFPVW